MFYSIFSNWLLEAATFQSEWTSNLDWPTAITIRATGETETKRATTTTAARARPRVLEANWNTICQKITSMRCTRASAIGPNRHSNADAVIITFTDALASVASSIQWYVLIGFYWVGIIINGKNDNLFRISFWWTFATAHTAWHP